MRPIYSLYLFLLVVSCVHARAQESKDFIVVQKNVVSIKKDTLEFRVAVNGSARLVSITLNDTDGCLVKEIKFLDTTGDGIVDSVRYVLNDDSTYTIYKGDALRRYWYGRSGEVDPYLIPPDPVPENEVGYVATIGATMRFTQHPSKQWDERLSLGNHIHAACGTEAVNGYAEKVIKMFRKDVIPNPHLLRDREGKIEPVLTGRVQLL